MKKTIIISMFFLFGVILLLCGNAYASSSSTVFVGEPIVLDNYSDVEITYNKIDINEETSEIINETLFTNESSKTITKKATIKLEDSFNKLTINSLKIVVNGLEINEIEKDGDNYSFNFQILPNEGKKIEISYKTDSSIKNAKVIKYNLEKIKGKNVKKFVFNTHILEEDVPLVQKIYPYCWEYDDENDNISVTYYDFKVNNITKDFIIQKETYQNLIYYSGESLNENEMDVIKNAKQYIMGEKSVDKYLRLDNDYFIKGISINNSLIDYNSIANKIIKYAKIKEKIKNGTIDDVFTHESGSKFDDLFMKYNSIETHTNLLIYDIYTKYLNKDYLPLYGKKICIDYVQSEQGKELYVYKNIDYESVNHEKTATKESEWKLLGTRNGRWNPNRIETREIYINKDLDGNEIQATEEEKIAYVNMLDADMYLRVVIYDGERTKYQASFGETFKSVYGYYNQAGKSILNSIEDDTRDLSLINNSILLNLEGAEFINFDNDYVGKYCQIPVFGNVVGYLYQEDGKYIVELKGTTSYDYTSVIGLGESDELIEQNRENNKQIRNTVEEKINSTKISNDTKEFIVEKEQLKTDNTQNNSFINEIFKDGRLIALCIMVVLLLMFIIIYIILRRKRNGRKSK